MKTVGLKLSLMVAAALGAAGLTREPVPVTTRDARLVLPRPDLIKALGRSHLQLVTDYFWLRTINRCTTVADPAEGVGIIALGNLIADLDPKLLHNYLMVGINAPTLPATRGDVWPNSKEAAQLVERGTRIFPTDNKLTLVLASNYMWYQHDLAGAARILQERTRHPGALPHFAPLATRLLAATGQFEASRDFTRAMLASAQDDETRELFEQRLKLIDFEELLAEIDAAIQKHLAEKGTPALTVGDLVKAGYLSQEPVDPYGGLILIRDGRSYSTVAKERLEVHGIDSD